MLFNSYIFIFVFLPVTLLGYFGLNKFNKHKLAKTFLCIMSLIFYGYFKPWYVCIIISSVLINYFACRVMAKMQRGWLKRTFLILLLMANIGILIYYKYFDFLILNINTLFKTSFNALNILLPLGISFFTFQQLSFVIDSYKNNENVNYNFLDYALFVTFFPQLIAGPIVLHSEVIPQFEDIKNHKINFENLSKGLMAFAFGLAKKVLIADLFGRVVDIGFANVGSLNTITSILTMLSYTFQIYFDFSGYCDMATGIALMFNIKLPMNFNSPYKATNVLEFWKRWHITLTRFFTQYVYIPLGGSRKGKIRTYINVFIIFLLSGIWHGANYTFIIWGIMHGIASIITRIFKDRIEKRNIIFNWIITFAFINLTWVMFRANSVQDALTFYKKLFTFDFGNTTMLINIINVFKLTEIEIFHVIIPKLLSLNSLARIAIQVFIAFGIYAVLNMKNTNERVESFKPNKRTICVTVILFFTSIISLSQVSTFLYFNF